LPHDITPQRLTDPALTRWTPKHDAPAPAWPLPPMMTAIGRGVLGRCPACGKTHLFQSFMRVNLACSSCGAPLGSYPADDAPPYFTILLVGHIIIPSMLLLEKLADPAVWVQIAIWLPLTAALTFALMQPVKGGTVGLLLKLGMQREQPGA
jgi:uncharacterized protein (DUF983 family)